MQFSSVAQPVATPVLVDDATALELGGPPPTPPVPEAVLPLPPPPPPVPGVTLTDPHPERARRLETKMS